MGTLKAWDFVEKYYPNYDSCDKIAENNDLEKIINGQIDGCAERMYNEKIEDLKVYFGGTLIQSELHDQAIIHFENEKAKSDSEIYKTAMENFLAESENQIEIVWTIEDFKSKAEELAGGTWHDRYDKTKLPDLLKRLKDEHDAEIGVNWGTIECYLEEIEIKSAEKFARKCSITGEGMNSGFVIGDGEFYIKDDFELLEKYIAEKTDYKSAREAYGDEFYYWTEWEDESDYQFILENGILKEI